MKADFLDNLDIYYFLTRENFSKLKQGETLECALRNSCGKEMTATLQHQEHEEGNDGIKLIVEDNNYKTIVNKRALGQIKERKSFETRSGMSEKVAIYILSDKDYALLLRQ